LVHDHAVEARSAKQACRDRRTDSIQTNSIAALQEFSDRWIDYCQIVDVRVQIPQTCRRFTRRVHRAAYQIDSVI
jgi:hypothetical protein